ncbi:MAG: malto-oligosyltrehalose synthase, partial [Gammaproteobacteria bacterium]
EKQRRARRRDKEEHKARLARLCRECPRINRFLIENLEVMNGVQGRPASFTQLHAILELQAYRLAFWKTASDEINYRRFFDINELAGLRMENDRVFEATHRFVFGLMEDGGIDGLRIDHVDGLYDPRGYLEKLHRRARGGRPVYIIAEKILAAHERLREDWPVHGTTGHDFANLVNGLFTDPAGERALNLAYHRFLGHKSDFDEELYAAKRRIVTVEMAGELNVLANQLNRISELNPVTRDFTLNSLRNALIEVVACFPVYRTYVSATPVHPEDRKYINWAIVQAKRRSAVIETGVFDFLESVLSLDIVKDIASGYPKSVLDFVMHFQQYTSPVMAKGLEDTALYRYHRLVSLNEVGSDPRRFSVSVNAFHYLNQERLKNWPHAMLATSTHDSKRSEDVRARINVLSEIPHEFQTRLRRWRFINRRHKRYIDKRPAPSRNDEYLLYQTLLGSWPLRAPDEQGLEEYRRRIGEYMLKAAREAKLLTSWSYTNEEYEQALLDFTAAVLSSSVNNPFLDDFVPFAESVAPFGLYNSLAQCLLKFTAPGMPDVYQGNELFEFSLTDPDNRRQVDYERRRILLGDLAALEDLPAAELAPAVRVLLDDMADGRSKLYLTLRALNLRRRYRTQFQSGDYIPLAVNGERADHVCAFARSVEGTAVLTVVPRLIRGFCPDRQPLGPVWSDTWLEIPDSLPQRRYRNELDGQSLPVQRFGDRTGIPLAAMLAHFPVALLTGAAEPAASP